MFQAAAETADSSLCFVCRTESKLAEMSRVDRLFERFPWLEYLWGAASLFVTAVVCALLSIQSTWIIIPLWLLLGALPRLIGWGLRTLHRSDVSQRLAGS